MSRHSLDHDDTTAVLQILKSSWSRDSRRGVRQRRRPLAARVREVHEGALHNNVPIPQPSACSCRRPPEDDKPPGRQAAGLKVGAVSPGPAARPVSLAPAARPACAAGQILNLLVGVLGVADTSVHGAVGIELCRSATVGILTASMAAGVSELGSATVLQSAIRAIFSLRAREVTPRGGVDLHRQSSMWCVFMSQSPCVHRRSIPLRIVRARAKSSLTGKVCTRIGMPQGHELVSRTKPWTPLSLCLGPSHGMR